jgi:hypothetical protein
MDNAEDGYHLIIRGSLARKLKSSAVLVIRSERNRSACLVRGRGLAVWRACVRRRKPMGKFDERIGECETTFRNFSVVDVDIKVPALVACLQRVLLSEIGSQKFRFVGRCTASGRSSQDRLPILWQKVTWSIMESLWGRPCAANNSPLSNPAQPRASLEK